MTRPLIPFVQNGYYASRNWIPLVKGNGFTTSGGGEQEEVWETASGSIVTFDAVPAPLRQLSVSVEPVQNLNGYDNPWPAGGGKNLINFDQVVTELVYTPAVYLTAGTYYLYVANEKTVGFNSFAQISTDGNTFTNISTDTGSSNAYADQTMGYNTKKCIVSVVNPTYLRVLVQTNTNLSGATVKVLLTKDATNYSDIPNEVYSTNPYFEQIWTPYSNICPITGWDSVTVNRTGKNLLDPALALNYPTCYTINPNGEVTVIAADTRSWSTIEAFPIKAGTYTFSSNALAWSDIRLSSENYATAHYLSTAVSSTTFTLAEDGFFKVKVGYSGATYPFTAKWQIELGSTATAYEPYQGNEYTIQLGETVYGGTLDVVNGKMVVDRRYTTIGAESVSKVASSNYANFQLSFADGDKPKSDQTSVICISSAFKGYSFSGAPASDDNYLFANLTGAIRVKDTANAGLTSNEWKTLMADVQLCYFLATPITITLTPEQISTLQGINNVWSDAGGVTVEYRVR